MEQKPFLRFRLEQQAFQLGVVAQRVVLDWEEGPKQGLGLL